MDIADIRRANMLLLIQQYKTQAQFAHLVGTDPSYISQLKKGYKKTGERVAMGDDLARSIEIALSLPYGAMDRQHAISNINHGGMFIVGDNHGTQIQNNHSNNTINHHASDNDWFNITSSDMYPVFVVGDQVQINTNKAPQAGNYVLANYNDAQILRKYRPKYDDDGTPYIQLVANNEDYPVIDSRHQNFKLIGVAVEYKRKLI